MAVRLLNFVAIWSVILTIQFSLSTALISSPDLKTPYPKAFSVRIYLSIQSLVPWKNIQTGEKEEF